jgi:hypothetical protein
MARLRPTKAVRVLTVEEKARVAIFFILLVEINLEKKVTRKRRAAQSSAKSFGGHSKSTKTSPQRALASSKSKVRIKRKKTLQRPKENIDITPLFFM